MRRWVVLLAFVVLVGCKAKSGESAAVSTVGGAGGSSSTSPAAPLSKLACQFAYRLAAPAANIEGLFNAHERACVLAGPAVCQVLSASLERSGAHIALGQLDMRATAAWAEQFREGLDHDASAAGGRIEHASTTSDDLTSDIASNAAAIPAAAAARNRLAHDIDSRKGKIADAVNSETSLAQAQSDLDTARAALRQDLSKVETSTISLTYQPIEGLVPADAVQAVGGATGGFIGNSLKVLAAIVTIASYLWPLALVGCLIAWLGPKLFRTKSAPTAPSTRE